MFAREAGVTMGRPEGRPSVDGLRTPSAGQVERAEAASSLAISSGLAGLLLFWPSSGPAPFWRRAFTGVEASLDPLALSA